MNGYVFVLGLTSFLLLVEKYPHQLIPVAFYLLVSSLIWYFYNVVL